MAPACPAMARRSISVRTADGRPYRVPASRGAASGAVQWISCSHTSRTASAQTKPVAIEMGIPSQKPQPAQLASDHDINTPNNVRTPTIAKAVRYSHRTRMGPNRRSNLMSSRSSGEGRRGAVIGGGLYNPGALLVMGSIMIALSYPLVSGVMREWMGVEQPQ